MTRTTTESRTLLPEELQSQLEEIEMKLSELEQRLELGPGETGPAKPIG